MNKKEDWHTEKLRRPKQRKPFARSTEIHEDKKRYNRAEDRKVTEQLIKEYIYKEEL